MSEPTCRDRPRRLAIPRSRRLVIDLMWLRDKVPTVAHDRVSNLSIVAAARESAAVRISWPVLFIKAFAIVALKYPCLRQTFMTWPWSHLYQHPNSIGMVVTHRDVGDEPWILWSRLEAPENQPLCELQRQLDGYQTGPVQQVFRRQWRFSAFPAWMRRIGWWLTLHLSGQTRARRCGTFFVTTIGSRGAEIQHPPGFLTGNLTYGPLDDRGHSRVTLAYDHRLFDGRMCADILAELENTLNGVISDELSAMSTARGSQRQAA